MSDSKTNNEDPRDTARDRLVDRVLAEALGGEQPPDLSQRILTAEEDSKVETNESRHQENRDGKAWKWAAQLALAAAILITTGVLLLPATQSARRAARIHSDSQSRSERAATSDAREEIVPSDLRYQEPAEPKPSDTLRLESAPAAQPQRYATAPLSDSLGESDPAASLGDFSDSPLSRQSLSAASGPVAPGQGEVLERQTPGAPASTPAPLQVVPPASSIVDAFGIAGEDNGRVAGRRMARSSAPATDAPPRDIRLRAKLGIPVEGEALASVDSFAVGRGINGDAGVVGNGGNGWFFYAPDERTSRDRYAPITENPFTQPAGQDALSTFSIDVDTASYTNVRQYLLDSRQRPPASAVRIEELVNYFDYDYPAPDEESEDPFAASMDVGRAPWNAEHLLVRIGIQGKKVDVDKRPLTNLVFLVDVSGSMNEPNKLPLVVAGLKALTDRLGENDRVAIVVYAGNEGLVLPSTSGMKKDEIRSALERLTAGGSTAGGAGLRLAYEIAERNKISGGVNRVVLCTDGDFNVGVTGTEELATMAEIRAKETGVFLTVLGFGRGNLNDEMLEAISGRGDGHYAYIDSEREARRVLSTDLAGTLVTIAKDVKLQVEFNPAKVAAYRLIGYENRMLAAEDFNDDTKDAGEIGAGHTVTALYEVVPVGADPPEGAVDDLKYQTSRQQAEGSRQELGDDSEASREPEPRASAVGVEPTADSRQLTAAPNELLTLKIRYKQPDGGASKKLEFPLDDPGTEFRQPSIDFTFASAVAQFGMLLRESRYAGDASYDKVLEAARESLGEDPQGYRAEFIDLARKARELSATR